MEKVRKTILQTFLLLAVVFAWDNWSYFVHYLPHCAEYQKEEAYIISLNSRRNYCKISLSDTESTVTGKVKHGAGEKIYDKIYVGYCEGREPQLVRIEPIVTGGFMMITVFSVIGNVMLMVRILKDRSVDGRK